MRFSTALTALAAALPSASAYWTGFNVGANNEDGSCKTQADWQTAFNKLKGLPQHITSVRLYASSDCNTLQNAVPAALATGTQILVGVWTEDAAHYTAEKNALQAAVNAHGHDWIIAISVGSEDLYRGDTSASALAQQIYDVRGMVRAMGVQAQVGHVDTWTAWVDNNNKAVITASDFIGLDACTSLPIPFPKETPANAPSQTPTSKTPPSAPPRTPSGPPSTPPAPKSTPSPRANGSG